MRFATLSRRIFLPLVFLTAVLHAEQEVLPLPLTSEAIEKYTEEAQGNIVQSIGSVISIPDEEKTSQNTMRPLNRLSNEIVENFAVLAFVKQAHAPSKKDADQAIERLMGLLFKTIIHNGDLYRTILGYAQNSLAEDKDLSAYEHYEIQCLLENCESLKGSLAKNDVEEISRLKKLNSTYEQTPYISLVSSTPTKSSVQKYPEEGVSVFCVNTCFAPHRFPIIFGGVPMVWQQRLPLLAEQILAADADIVCLQEVHAEAATYALYDALKEHYTYFYGAIGPKFIGFSLNSLGMPSGLFVASKYPLEKPQYTLFPISGFAMNYGFFDCLVKNGPTCIAHIYTTHMQSLDIDEKFAEIRALQLKQILDKMQSDRDAQQEPIPYFLCGDLNIPYGGGEMGEALIQAYFFDDYNQNQEAVGEENSTSTEYFSNYFISSSKNPEEIDPHFQILDYALLLREAYSGQQYRLNTVRIKMNDLKKTQEAISDHHALLTRITH